jgi:outer membrane protein OmpA-like peptidoglycan-associated protein
VNYALFAITGLIVLGFSFASVYAHTTVEVAPYEIEVGWQDEPPVVGLLNAITIHVREPGDVEGVSTGITSAFKKLEASVVSGGASKVLDINVDPRPGHYYAKIIPTKTGSLQVELKGEINGVQIDTVIPIEDVESTSILDFPPTSSSSSGQEVTALKNAVTSLQKDISSIKAQGVVTNTDSDGGATYNFAVFGLSLGAAGVILAIIAMVRRK